MQCVVYHIPMERIRPVSVKQMIIETLSKEIVTCKILPGQVLNERELSLMLGVSRTPVREAIQFLATEGFITGSERKSWRVTVPDVNTICDVFGFRRIIELSGLDALFQLNDDQLLDYAGSLFDDINLDNVRQDRESYLKRDRELHRIFANSLGNSRAMETFNKLSVWVDWVRHLLPRNVITQNGLIEHKNLCAAIRARDLPESKRLLANHISRAEQDFVNLMSKSKNNNFIAEETVL
ncbi:MAG: hypothetical protein CVV48_15390 [Spirochaetae bacterium HGW-Spirochaetae-4]|nr:MAG: hypothetical protein CVV48_15390 [Spirochaetae bacterium HGW-Spirochaetae-4]